MSGCCGGPGAPKVYNLKVGGELVGLVGVEEAFQNVKNLDLSGEEAAEKLLEILGQRNYIPQSSEGEYKIALLKEYDSFLVKSGSARDKADTAAKRQ